MTKQNQNKPGYKKTKVGWVPVEWSVARLREKFNIFAGGDVYKLNFSRQKSAKYRFPIYSNSIEKDGLYGFADSYQFSENCITVTARGTLGYAIPRFEKFNAIIRLLVLIPKSEIDIVFVSEYINANINFKLEKTSIPQLTIPKLGAYFIPLPPLPEQKKIAKILSTWDRAIELVEKFIDAKRRLKKGLMQQLLTEKIRFREFRDKQWQEVPLRKFLTFTPRPIPKPATEYKSLGIRSHGKGIFEKVVDDPKKVMMDTLYRVKEDDLIVNITFAWEGAIAIVRKCDEDGFVSHRFPTFVFNRKIMLPEYFKQVILTKYFVHKLGLVSPGGAGRNRVLNKNDFLKLSVFIPQNINEQRKVAAVLNGLDNEIKYFIKILKLFKQQKKGLMQKLLTGKIRVKV